MTGMILLMSDDRTLLSEKFCHYQPALDFFIRLQENQMKDHRIITLPVYVDGWWRVGYRRLMDERF